MKKQILTIAAILIFSTLSYAKKCTTENVGNSPKGTAMTTIWQSRNSDGSFVIAVNYTFGKVEGTVTYKDSDFTKRNLLVGVSRSGNLIYDDTEDDLGTYEVACSMNENGTVMTTNGDTEFVLRSSITNEPAKAANPDLGDWAAEPAKQSPPPPRMVQPQGGSKVSTNPDLGDWAPVK